MCISRWNQGVCRVNSVIPTHPCNTKDVLQLTYGQFLLPKKSMKKAKTRLKSRTQLSLFISKSFGHRFPLQEGWTKHRHFPWDGWTTTVLHIQQPSNHSKAELSSQSFPNGKVLLTGLVLDHQLQVWVSRAVHYQSALLICTYTNSNPTTSVLPEVHFIGNVAAVISAKCWECSCTYLSKMPAWACFSWHSFWGQHRLKTFLLHFSSHNHLFPSAYQKGKKMNETLGTTNQI